jgi:hypothetical protein
MAILAAGSAAAQKIAVRSWRPLYPGNAGFPVVPEALSGF